MLDPEMIDPSLSREMFDAVAKATRLEFALSYLYKAKARGSMITPHTLTAYDRLIKNQWAMKAITDAGFTLAKPLHFGHPERPDTPRQYLMAAE